MKNANEKIKSVATKLASAMIDGDTWDWPPTCSLFVYQPMRPYTKKATDDTHQDNDYDALNQ